MDRPAENEIAPDRFVWGQPPPGLSGRATLGYAFVNGTHGGERTLLSAAFDFPPPAALPTHPRVPPLPLITALCVLLFASASAQSKKPQTGPPTKLLEAKVRKAWEDFKNKN
jgi:hypothetical protein